MIAYFPRIYKDEIAYSILCRFGAHIGITNNCQAREYLYGERTARIDTYSLGRIRKDLVDIIKSRMSYETFILNHTMFPYFAAFNFDKDSLLQKALAGAPYNNGYKEIKCIMKYCPLCAKEDYLRYGESYYHRKHQLMTACTKHRIRLNSVRVATGKRMLVSFIPLEDVKVDGGELADEEKIRFSEYVEKFLLHQFSFDECLNQKHIVRLIDKKINILEPYFRWYYKAGGYIRWKSALNRDIAKCNAIVILRTGYILGISVEELFLKKERKKNVCCIKV